MASRPYDTAEAREQRVLRIQAEKEAVLASAQVRDPCARCEVRPEFHDQFGCGDYKRRVKL